LTGGEREGRGKVWFDNIVVKRLIFQDDFEQYAEGDFPDGWNIGSIRKKLVKTM